MIQRVEAGRELSHHHLNDLGKALPGLVSQGVTAIHLDTSRVSDFDSQTLEAILEFDAICQSRGLAVWLVNPSKVLALALDITGLWDHLNIGRPEDVEAALARMQAGGTNGRAPTGSFNDGLAASSPNSLDLQDD